MIRTVVTVTAIGLIVAGSIFYAAAGAFSQLAGEEWPG